MTSRVLEIKPDTEDRHTHIECGNNFVPRTAAQRMPHIWTSHWAQDLDLGRGFHYSGSYPMGFKHSGAQYFDLGRGFHYSGSYPMVFQHSAHTYSRIGLGLCPDVPLWDGVWAVRQAECGLIPPWQPRPPQSCLAPHPLRGRREPLGRIRMRGRRPCSEPARSHEPRRHPGCTSPPRTCPGLRG
jgi:hypothetical protein